MGAEPTMRAKLAGEFIGTFLLVFTLGCNVLSGNTTWGGISIGCLLMVAIYALGGISGANFNPAVSLALALTESAGGKGIDWKTAGSYMGVQVVAGAMASVCYSVLFWDTFNLRPADGFGYLESGLCEASLPPNYVDFGLRSIGDNSPNQFYGFAIGSVVHATTSTPPKSAPEGTYGAGAVSGGCFNPAVAFAIDLASAGLGFGWCIYWVLCEFVGAAMAVGAFMLVRPQDFGKEKGVVAELFSEFLGTFILVLTVGLNVLGKSHAGAYSIAASLTCMIYALGDVSGAHFNPAVTIALLISGRCGDGLSPAKAGSFVGAQLAGGGVAALMATLIHRGETFPLGPGETFGWVEVAIAEAVFTFVLCYVVLCVAVSATTKAPVMFGLAIGACVTAGSNAIGAISGGSLNPAVSFGIVAADMIKGGVIVPFLAYSLFECIGAVAAAGVFKVTHAVDVEGMSLDSKA